MKVVYLNYLVFLSSEAHPLEFQRSALVLRLFIPAHVWLRTSYRLDVLSRTWAGLQSRNRKVLFTDCVSLGSQACCLIPGQDFWKTHPQVGSEVCWPHIWLLPLPPVSINVVLVWPISCWYQHVVTIKCFFSARVSLNLALWVFWAFQDDFFRSLMYLGLDFFQKPLYTSVVCVFSGFWL